MSSIWHVTQLRVRYGETDQMGTFYNARVLDWFECGRTEALRALGLTYREMEEQGVLLPVIEAHIVYQGRARYDDLIEIRTQVGAPEGVRLRFEEEIRHAGAESPIASGYTVHAVTDRTGRPIRPPAWVTSRLNPEPKS